LYQERGPIREGELSRNNLRYGGLENLDMRGGFWKKGKFGNLFPEKVFTKPRSQDGVNQERAGKGDNVGKKGKFLTGKNLEKGTDGQGGFVER